LLAMETWLLQLLLQDLHLLIVNSATVKAIRRILLLKVIWPTPNLGRSWIPSRGPGLAAAKQCLYEACAFHWIRIRTLAKIVNERCRRRVAFQGQDHQ
jgi:hypothetical protein